MEPERLTGCPSLLKRFPGMAFMQIDEHFYDPNGYDHRGDYGHHDGLSKGQPISERSLVIPVNEPEYNRRQHTDDGKNDNERTIQFHSNNLSEMKQ